MKQKTLVNQQTKGTTMKRGDMKLVPLVERLKAAASTGYDEWRVPLERRVRHRRVK